MHIRNCPNLVITGILIALITFGCASTSPYWQKTAYGTWNFSQSEIEKLPSISVHNILSTMENGESQSIQIFVREKNIKGTVRVIRLQGVEDVYVQDDNGNETKINLSQITDIQTIRQIKITPRKKTTGERANEIAEGALYAPLIPITIVTLPFLKVMSLDVGKNAADDNKAELAYGGLTKKDLLKYIGVPIEKYQCYGVYEGSEVWVYRKGQVLRGGRALFIHLNDGKVWNASYHTTFFKDHCSLMEPNP